MSRAVLLILSLVAGLAACTPWPQHGRGGYAEVLPLMLDDTAESKRLIEAKKTLARLADAGAWDNYPANMQRASLQWNRAIRALSGGFIQEARSDLETLETYISDINRKAAAPVATPEIIASSEDKK